MPRGPVRFDRQQWLTRAILTRDAPLRAYVRRFIEQPSDVADAVRENCARVLSLSDEALDAIRIPLAFLFTVARNVAAV